MVSCNFANHATCPLALMTYKYSELQKSFATQKLNWNASCKTPIFLIMYFIKTSPKNFTCCKNLGQLILWLSFWNNYSH
jgi:hypothetical protein